MTDQNMNEVSFEIELLDKHKNMEPNTNRMIFIGVGIENECYLSLTCSKVDKNSLTNGIREKYSINHFSNYKENVFENSLQKILTDKSYSIPVLMNSHSFTKTDVNNQHKTLDTIDNIPN
jgi:hypothetical protein